MTFRVTLSETAARQLRKLPAGTRTLIVKGLRVLEEDPFRPRPKADIRVIEGTDPRKLRIRIGDYRAIYAVVEREVKVVEIFIRGRAIGNQWGHRSAVESRHNPILCGFLPMPVESTEKQPPRPLASTGRK